MLNMLAFFAFAPAQAPIELRIVMDSDIYRTGTPIMAKLVAKNISKKPIVIAKPAWDGSPTASARMDMLKKGNIFETSGESSIPATQVGVNCVVSENKFVILKPNESLVLYWKKFTSALDFHGLPPNLKSSWTTVTPYPIPAGSYTIKAIYSYDADALIKHWKLDWNRNIVFPSREVERLFKSAVKGNWNLTSKVQVRSQ